MIFFISAISVVFPWFKGPLMSTFTCVFARGAFFFAIAPDPVEFVRVYRLPLMISPAMAWGTSAYLRNSMAKVARPWVRERSTVA